MNVFIVCVAILRVICVRCSHLLPLQQPLLKAPSKPLPWHQTSAAWHNTMVCDHLCLGVSEAHENRPKSSTTWHSQPNHTKGKKVSKYTRKHKAFKVENLRMLFDNFFQPPKNAHGRGNNVTLKFSSPWHSLLCSKNAKEMYVSAYSACGTIFSLIQLDMHVNPFPFEWVLRALNDFTLSNARRFYSSMGNILDGKGLTTSKTMSLLTRIGACVIAA